ASGNSRRGRRFSKTTTLSWDSACGCASTVRHDSEPPQRQSARRRVPGHDSCDIGGDSRRLAGPSHSRLARKEVCKGASSMSHIRVATLPPIVPLSLPVSTGLRYRIPPAPSIWKGDRDLAREKLQ